MRKRSHSLSGLCLMLLASATHAQTIKLTREDKEHLLTEKFQTITRAEALPASVKNEFMRTAHARTFQMANPGQPFQVTDVITKPGLPSYRLIFAGLTDNLCVLHYEHGGIAHSYALVLFHLSGGKAHFVWRDWLHHSIPNIADLRKEIKSRHFDDGDNSRAY